MNPLDFFDQDEDFASLPSLPMPNFSPPPLPTETVSEITLPVDDDADSFGVTLFNFDSEMDGDLNFRVC